MPTAGALWATAVDDDVAARADQGVTSAVVAALDDDAAVELVAGTAASSGVGGGAEEVAGASAGATAGTAVPSESPSAETAPSAPEAVAFTTGAAGASGPVRMGATTAGADSTTPESAVVVCWTAVPAVPTTWGTAGRAPGATLLTGAVMVAAAAEARGVTAEVTAETGVATAEEAEVSGAVVEPADGVPKRSLEAEAAVPESSSHARPRPAAMRAQRKKAMTRNCK